MIAKNGTIQFSLAIIYIYCVCKYNLSLYSTLSFSRRRALQRRAQEAKVSSEEEEEMLRDLERRETEYMRLQRHKVGLDDFELLTVIGKGAFGEV